ncbi:Hypothetical predicted protein [Prunus dulcis]|uniref:Uncharacterized protein n=1 Tax=Prunus dulcis TaxID=3755 RepID=A0A5E4F7D0_PRUDU|nr:hypothetical protein L3X38_030227 [Prunus dulcis]VVA23310.1 Hypothetical predicted protein [Prunus dulcis]VVA37698.1 Hypothetical predicted protein [Prunus dulcis]
MDFPKDVYNQIPHPHIYSSTNIHLPIPNISHHDSHIIHTQRVLNSSYSPTHTAISTTYDLNGLPAVRSGYQNLHLIHASSFDAYRGIPVFPNTSVIPVMRSYQPRPRGGHDIAMINQHGMIMEVQPTQTRPTFPNSTLNLNLNRFQPPAVAHAPHFPLNNIASPTTFSSQNHYVNISHNPIMYRAPPPSFSSNINIGRATIMSNNQAAVPISYCCCCCGNVVSTIARAPSPE